MINNGKEQSDDSQFFQGRVRESFGGMRQSVYVPEEITQANLDALVESLMSDPRLKSIADSMTGKQVPGLPTRGLDYLASPVHEVADSSNEQAKTARKQDGGTLVSHNNSSLVSGLVSRFKMIWHAIKHGVLITTGEITTFLQDLGPDFFRKFEDRKAESAAHKEYVAKVSDFINREVFQLVENFFRHLACAGSDREFLDYKETLLRCLPPVYAVGNGSKLSDIMLEVEQDGDDTMQDIVRDAVRLRRSLAQISTSELNIRYGRTSYTVDISETTTQGELYRSFAIGLAVLGHEIEETRSRTELSTLSLKYHAKGREASCILL